MDEGFEQSPKESAERHRPMGFFAVGGGLLLAVSIYYRPEGLRVPAWVAFAAAAAFVFAGLSVIAQSTRLKPWQDLFTALLVFSMLLIPGWIALGNGDHQCEVSVGNFAGIGSDTACRVVFGIGGLFTAAILFLILRSIWQKLKSRSPR